MSTDASSANRRRDLLLFFVLAYLFSWLIMIPLALAEQGITPPLLPTWAHYLVGYGPMLSAFLVTSLSEGGPGLKGTALRMRIRRKVAPGWWLVGFSPLLLGLVLLPALSLIMGSEARFSSFGEVDFLPPLGFGALLLWILTFGIGEETGWRGFALPRLQHGRSALLATVLLWFLWALWHLPAFFYLYNPTDAIGWLIGLLSGAIVLTWLFNSVGGSVLVVAAFHGCFNFVTSTDAGNGAIPGIVSMIVLAWSIAVVAIFKPADLSRSEKIVA